MVGVHNDVDDGDDDNSNHEQNDDDPDDVGRGETRGNNDAIGNKDIEPPEFFVHKYNFYIFPSSAEHKRKRPGSHQPNNNNGPNNNHPTSQTREVTLNPSSIHFLNGQNMDFNRWLKEGVPYTLIDDADTIAHAFREKYTRKEREMNEEKELSKVKGGRVKTKKDRLQPDRSDDIAFIARTMASLREWIDSAAPSLTLPPRPAPTNNLNQPAPVAINNLNNNNNHNHRQPQPPQVPQAAAALLQQANTTTTTNTTPTSFLRSEERDGIAHFTPPCNSFLRRCLYEAIEFEYPALVLEKARHPYNTNQICVLRLNAAEKVARDRRLKKDEWRKMHVEKIGMTRVFEALSGACRGELGVVGSLEDEYVEFLEGGGEEEGRNGAGGLASDTNGRGGESSTDQSSPSSSTNNNPTIKPPTQIGRRIPLIVHNGLMDLLFLLTHFHSHTLPSTHSQTKSLIHHYFPLVYDTKVLSSECSDGIIRGESTALGDLYAKNCLALGGGGGGGGGAPPPPPLPHHQPHHRHHGVNGNAVQHHHHGAAAGAGAGDAIVPRVIIANSGEEDSTQMHEAAYDAFMTGTVFQCLCRRILRQELVRCGGYYLEGEEDCTTYAGIGSLLFLDENHPHCVKSFLFGRNKLFLMQTLYTIDLEKHGKDSDPLNRRLRMATTYRVSGIDSSVYTRDIVRVLMNVRDTNPEAAAADIHDNNVEEDTVGSQKVGYEIVWIDDHSFMVATRSPGYGRNQVVLSPDAAAEKSIESTLKRHGALIRSALQTRFPTQTIVTLEEHFMGSKTSEGRGRSGSIGVVGNLFGISQLVSNVFLRVFMGRGERKRCREEERVTVTDDSLGSTKRRRVA